MRQILPLFILIPFESPYLLGFLALAQALLFPTKEPGNLAGTLMILVC